MNDQAFTPIMQRPLDRAGYAVRVVACIAGLIGFGAVLGIIFRNEIVTDPMEALMKIQGIAMIANLIVGICFVVFTHRRALDTAFGKNGRAAIATVIALPTMILPQYGLLVFIAMMFFKSAPVDAEVDDIEDDTGTLRPLQAGE